MLALTGSPATGPLRTWGRLFMHDEPKITGHRADGGPLLRATLISIL
jgi:hypothetical protein